MINHTKRFSTEFFIPKLLNVALCLAVSDLIFFCFVSELECFLLRILLSLFHAQFCLHWNEATWKDSLREKRYWLRSKRNYCHANFCKINHLPHLFLGKTLTFNLASFCAKFSHSSITATEESSVVSKSSFIHSMSLSCTVCIAHTGHIVFPFSVLDLQPPKWNEIWILFKRTQMNKKKLKNITSTAVFLHEESTCIGFDSIFIWVANGIAQIKFTISSIVCTLQRHRHTDAPTLTQTQLRALAISTRKFFVTSGNWPLFPYHLFTPRKEWKKNPILKTMNSFNIQHIIRTRVIVIPLTLDSIEISSFTY